MKTEDIPEWVPLIVRRFAVNLNVDLAPEVVRFLMDIRMRPVWLYLMNCPMSESSADFLQSSRHRELVEIAGEGQFSNREEACVALFYTVWLWPIRENIVITKAAMEERARPYTEAVNAIDIILSRFKNDNPSWSYKDKEILTAVKFYCEHWREKLALDGDPYRLDRQGQSVERDVIRGHIRALSMLTKTLYGNSLRGQLAKIANVVFSPEQEISPENVKEWLSDRPHKGG